jgi:uncharacterized protein (DUF4415 family)
MVKSATITITTLEEAKERIARGEDRTDWARVDALTEEELEASIDYEEEGYPIPVTTRAVYDPARKQQITLRLDRDVVEWFKSQGPGYQTRMNAVLRSYMLAKAK